MLKLSFALLLCFGTKDPRIAVLKSVIRTIRTRAAKSFILENVARLVTHNRGKTLRMLLKKIKRQRDKETMKDMERQEKTRRDNDRH